MKIKIDVIDDLFSKCIRLLAMVRVGGCERCLAPKYDTVKDNGDIFPAWKQLQCSHFFGRGRKSVRWDEDNAAGLCFGCHQYFTSHPLEHVEWFKARLGDRFELLQGRMRILGRPDRAAIELYLTGKIDELIRGR